MIYSKVIYVYYDLDTGMRFGSTGLPQLSEKSGITMGRLRYAFDVQKLGSKTFDEKYLIIKLLTTQVYTQGSGSKLFNS